MLRATGLHYTYPGAPRPALADVSLQVAPGRLLGLLGPNGAGKSTLLAALTGLVHPDAGTITWAGEPLDTRAGRPRVVALAPQQDAFYPMLSVAENLACFAAAAGLGGANARQRGEQALVQTRLQDWRTRRAGQLSGGLKRRLNLAIALLPAPAVLLLDEPTAGVDPQSRAFLRQVLRTLADEGIALVVSSHLMGEIEALADEVLILDQGRVLRCAPLAELLADQSRRLTLDIGAADLAAAQALLAAHGELRPLDGTRLELQLAPRSSPARVLGALEAAGLALRGAEFGRTRLESTFMALTDEALRDDDA